MLKRSVAALLWFYTGWYAGAMIAFHLGIAEMLGPILGIAAAGLFAGDPRRIIWVRPSVSVMAPSSQTTAPDPA